MTARWEMELPIWMFSTDGRYLGRSFTLSVGEDGLYTVLPGATPLRVGDSVEVRLIMPAAGGGSESVRLCAQAVVRKRETLLGEESEESGLELEFVQPLPGPWAVAPAA